jgi:hypothetical protein
MVSNGVVISDLWMDLLNPRVGGVGGMGLDLGASKMCKYIC